MAETVGPSIAARKTPLILVVDDSEELVEIYTAIFEAEGFHVASRGDAKRGLEAVVKLRPDAVVLDMMMPEGGGVEFLRGLKARGLPSPPVIACSGYERLRAQALELGALDFLLKPVGASDLVASLRSVLGGAPAAARDLQLGHALADRARMKRDREELLARVDLHDPALLARMDVIARWLARFFDVTCAFVSVHLESMLYDLAVAGPDGNAQAWSSPSDAFCGELTEAGSTLLLEDTAKDPCFSTHAAARSGTRFYAGAPAVTPTGLVLGTVCLTDRSPHAFRSEDMPILEHLGNLIGAQLATLSRGEADVASPVTTDGALDPEIFAALVTSELRHAARSGGTLGLAIAELTGDAREAIAATSAFGAPRLAISHRDGNAIALLLGAEDSDSVRRGLSRALFSLGSDSAGMRGAGVAQVELAAGSECEGEEAARLEALALEACRRSIARHAGTRDRTVEWL